MSQPKHIAVRYPDKFRLWQELVLAAEREGSLFLPLAAPVVGELAPGEEIIVDIGVGHDGVAFELKATVESFRPASMRFSRGVAIRIASVDLDRVRGMIGLLPADAAGVAGRAERRFRVRWPLWFRTPAILRRCLTIDISEGGMQAEMPERVRRGHVVEFTLATPQGHELMMAGEVQWASETEKKIGVQFLFADTAAAQAFHSMLRFAVRSMGARARSGTILVLDEDVDAREYMIAALAARGYRVLWTSTGEEALSLAREEKPDLVLLDPRGTRLGADALCQALRGDKELCETPVFLLSDRPGVDAAPDAVARALQTTALHTTLTTTLMRTERLEKPLQLRALVTKVAQYLDESVAA